MKEQETSCVFCKIIKGEIPAQKIPVEEGFVAIKDINPISSGHTVVFSKHHYYRTEEMPSEELGRLFQISVRLAERIQKEQGAEGYNLLVCEGEAAQSTVPHRPHIHIIPRRKGDNLHIDPRS